MSPTRSPDAHGLSEPESLFAGLLAELDAGRAVDFEAFCARHPSHALELQTLWRQHLDAARLRSAALADAAAQQRFEPRAPSSDGRAQAAPSSSLFERLDARRLGAHRYEHAGEIGRGGMGAVLRVWDQDLRRELAMKVALEGGQRLAPEALDPRLLARFLEEAQITGQLEHPGIVPVHEVGVDELGRVYFTMPLVRGVDLEQVFVLARDGREGWSLTRALGVLHKVCDAMSYAHSRGVIHRDLKPANVMVGHFGEAYVMDWGLARVLDAAPSDAESEVEPRARTLGALSVARREAAGSDVREQLYTVNGDVLGTPEYMSPEQAHGRLAQLDARTDVYSVGAMLYRLLVGAAPYAADGRRRSAAEVLEQVRAGPPRALRELAPAAPAELQAICEKAMARERERRYADMGALGDEIRAFLEQRVVHAHDDSAWAYTRKWVRRNPWLAAAVAGVLLALAIALRVEFAREAQAAASALEKAHLSDSLALEVRQRSVDSALATARLALDRGAWSEALAAVERAQEMGYADEVDALCRKLEAHLALSNRAQAAQLLEQLQAYADLGPHRGRALLLEAQHHSTTWGARERCFAAARAALEAGLAPADEHFARAFIAPTTPQALAELEQTLALAPFHARAHELRATLLVILGRFDEALVASQRLAALFPSDISASVLLSIAEPLAGRRAEGDAARERVRRALASDALAGYEATWNLLDLFRDLPVSSFNNGAFAFLPALIPRLSMAMHPITSGAQIQVAPGLMCLSQLAQEFRAGAQLDSQASLPQVLLGLANTIAADPLRYRPMFQRMAAIHPDALFPLLEGLCLIADPERESTIAERLEVRELFERSTRLHSIAPGIPRAALRWLALCEADLATRVDLSHRAAALERCRTYLAFDELTVDDSQHFMWIASSSLDFELADAIAQKTLLSRPADPEAKLLRARGAAGVQRFDYALGLCDAVLALDPQRERTKLARRALEAILVRAREQRAEIEGWKAEAGSAAAAGSAEQGR